MSERDRIVVAQYCDDIRQEVGNKFSLMGCYGADMFVNKLPTLLPKLCAQVKAMTYPEQPFERLSFKAYLNDELIAEMAAPVPPVVVDKSAQRSGVVALMTFSPLGIQGPSELRIDVETESGVTRGVPLTIREGVGEKPIAPEQVTH